MGSVRYALALSFALALVAVDAPGMHAQSRQPTNSQRADAPAYWVLFKASTAHSSAAPALSAFTLAQRGADNIAIGDEDRPLPDHLLNEIRSTGARIRSQSRWLRAVSVQADATTLKRIAKLEDVQAIERVAVLSTQSVGTRTHRSPHTAHNAAGFPSAPDSAYGQNIGAMRELSLPTAHTLGFTGRGVRMAIIDTGFRLDHESLAGARILATRDFIQNDAIVSDQAGDTPGQQDHGTRVLSLIAANRANVLIGSAFEADFLLAKVDKEPGDTQADEDRWVAAFEWADSMGARVINSSLGYRYTFTDKAPYTPEQMNGRTTITSRVAASAARRGIVLVNAVGNNGPAATTVVAPADADSIIAAGATDSLGRAATFANGAASSRGPTADGRIKPDLSARGVRLLVASPNNKTTYDLAEGTSFSAPLLSGSAALVRQAWPALSAIAIRQALILAATRAGNPDNNVGHGIPNVASAILFPGGLFTGSINSTTGSGVLAGLSATFSWTAPQVHPNIRPVRYRLELARDSAFTDVVYSDTVSEAFSLTLKRAIRPEPRLFWRVVADGPAGIRRTTQIAGPFSVPNWVKLQTFAGTSPSFTNTTKPTFVFDPLQAVSPVGPLIFDLQVLTSDALQPVQTVRNITGNSVTLATALNCNTPYLYRVIARAPTNAADTVQSIAPFVVNCSAEPPTTTLYQNFPNPFPRADLGTLTTTIWFDLQSRSTVELAVYDIRGRLVRQLIPARGCAAVTLDPGQYGRGGMLANDACVQSKWDGRDDDGRFVHRGVYLVRLKAGSVTQTRRMLYLPPE